jgi:hypothetical protein
MVHLQNIRNMYFVVLTSNNLYTHVIRKRDGKELQKVAIIELIHDLGWPDHGMTMLL